MILDDLVDGRFQDVAFERAGEESLQDFQFVAFTLGVADTAGFVIFARGNFPLSNHCFQQFADFRVLAAFTISLRARRHVAVAHGTLDEPEGAGTNALRLILFGCLERVENPFANGRRG